MPEVKKKKVGFFQRFLASIGKRWMYRRARKVTKLLVNLSYREIIRLLLELHEDKLEPALNAAFELALHAGPDFLNEWVEGANVIFSKYVGDHALWIKSGYYSFTGDHISYIKYFPPEKAGEPHRVVWRLDKCFLCAGMIDDSTFSVKKESFGVHGWGAVIAGIFQATTKMINDYTGIEFVSKVRETKCLLRGDPYGEFVAEFFPKSSNTSA